MKGIELIEMFKKAGWKELPGTRGRGVILGRDEDGLGTHKTRN